MNITTNERRHHQRFLAPELSIALQTLKSKTELTQNTNLCVLDFNRFGMAIESEHNFKIGDELCLLVSDKYKREIKINGFVCNRARTNAGYRCGLYFLAQNESAFTLALVAMERGLELLVS